MPNVEIYHQFLMIHIHQCTFLHPWEEKDQVSSRKFSTKLPYFSCFLIKLFSHNRARTIYQNKIIIFPVIVIIYHPELQRIYFKDRTSDFYLNLAEIDSLQCFLIDKFL